MRIEIGPNLGRIFKEASLTDWILAFTTIGIFVIAIVAAGISFFQWREMHSGGVDTHDLAVSAKAQADATKAEADSMHDLAEKELEQAKATDELAKQAAKSAEAAIHSARDADVSAKATKEMASLSSASLENAKQSEHLDQRPWIPVATVRLTRFDMGSDIEAQVAFTNSGRSPALHVSLAGAVEVLDRNAEPHFIAAAPFSEWKAYRALAPQTSNTWTKDGGLLTSNDKDDIERFRKSIWVWGYIKYDDMFGDSHVTEFCGNTLNHGVKSFKVTPGIDLNLCEGENGMN